MQIEIPDEIAAAAAEIASKTGQDVNTLVAEMVTGRSSYVMCPPSISRTVRRAGVPVCQGRAYRSVRSSSSTKGSVEIAKSWAAYMTG
jgi:hypothetical protein